MLSCRAFLQSLCYCVVQMVLPCGVPGTNRPLNHILRLTAFGQRRILHDALLSVSWSNPHLVARTSNKIHFVSHAKCSLDAFSFSFFVLPSFSLEMPCIPDHSYSLHIISSERFHIVLSNPAALTVKSFTVMLRSSM